MNIVLRKESISPVAAAEIEKKTRADADAAESDMRMDPTIPGAVSTAVIPQETIMVVKQIMTTVADAVT